MATSASTVNTILVVSEKPEHEDLVQEILGLQFEVMGCASDAVLSTLTQHAKTIKVIVLHLDEQVINPLATLETILAKHPIGEVIVFSKEEDVALAVRAMQMGAFHYLFEPLNPDVLEVLVMRAMYKLNVIDKIRKISLQKFMDSFNTERGLTLAKELADKRRKEGKPIFHKELLALLPRPHQMSAENIEKVMDNISEIQSHTRVDWEKTKILVVEDDAIAGAGLLKILNQHYEEVTLATKGSEALALELGAVDIILLDVFLPEKGLGGIELLPILKEKYPQAEIIVITAFQISSIAVEVLKGGAWSYLNKPFNSSDLLVTIANAIQVSSLKKVLADLELNVLPETLSLQDRIGLFQELYTRRGMSQQPTTYRELLLFSPELASRIPNTEEPLPKGIEVTAFIRELWH